LRPTRPANFAQGSWDVAKAKTSPMKDTAMDRISETTGGKIAAAINARNSEEPAFGGYSHAFIHNPLRIVPSQNPS